MEKYKQLKYPMILSNHYSGYDPENQFRPQINRGQYHSLSGEDFLEVLVEPIYSHPLVHDDEALFKRLSKGQKALYSWSYLDNQVTNGGFSQFYYNDCEHYIPSILDGLRLINDTPLHQLLMQAHEIYYKNFESIEHTLSDDKYNEVLDETLKQLEQFDEIYYSMHHKTIALFEAYSRQHPEQFVVVDKQGNLVPSW